MGLSSNFLVVHDNITSWFTESVITDKPGFVKWSAHFLFLIADKVDDSI